MMNFDPSVENVNPIELMSSGKKLFRQISAERKSEFIKKGFKERHFFPHRTYYLFKPGPDGYKIASWIFENVNPSQMMEAVIYAMSPVIDEFPDDLFFDNELVWHQQQFGKKGQIATATLLIDGKNLYTLIHLSDVYQRISRKREYKTRIENRFKGWSVLLINSILNFALENHLENVFTPTSGLALRHTDKKRNPKKEIFERIYDVSVSRYYITERINDWWKINLSENRQKIVIPEMKNELINGEKTICLAHDIEAGFGHIGYDSEVVEFANRNHKSYLKQMLQIEKEFKIPATYNVLGSMLTEVRERIDSVGQCISFHSYNHKIEEEQLARCRNVDYRIKGYRPPQSKIAPELTIENLSYHNFEWLASSVHSIKTNLPKLEKGIVNIPIMFDDYSMYKDKISYEEWESKAIETIEENDFVAFCLHDCYGNFWLPHYKNFLSKIQNKGKFKTFNQVADEMFLANAR